MRTPSMCGIERTKKKERVREEMRERGKKEGKDGKLINSRIDRDRYLSRARRRCATFRYEVRLSAGQRGEAVI